MSIIGGESTHKVIEVKVPQTHFAAPSAVSSPAPSAASGGRRNPYLAHRKLLSPQRVRELSVLKPWISVRDTIWCWAWIMAAWTLVAFVPTWWSVLIAIPVIGTRYYALFIIGHDGMHRRIFASGPASDLFTDLFLIGPIAMCNRVNSRPHLDHHQHLANDNDPDLHKHACFNKTTKGEYLLFLTGLASVVKVFRSLFLGLGSEDEHDHEHSGEQVSETVSSPAHPNAHAKDSVIHRYTLRDVVIILAWQAALVGGLTTLAGIALGARTPLEILLKGWWGYAALWVVPVYLGTYLPNLIRSFVEHSHPENDDKADEHRLITFLANPIERLVLAPMNMNYHIAHHLWPSIPYYNLPTADRELRALRPEQLAGLTWRTSYVGYMWRYFVALPLQECRNSRHRRGGNGKVQAHA